MYLYNPFDHEILLCKKKDLKVNKNGVGIESAKQYESIVHILPKEEKFSRIFGKTRVFSYITVLK